MTDPFRIEPASMGIRRYWLARGELRDTRFEVPDGLWDVSFVNARLIDVDLSASTFSHFLAHDSVFERCDFSGATFENASLGATGYGGQRWDRRAWPATLYRECVFRRTRLSEQTFWGNARFERCRFENARLRRMVFTKVAEFVECVFHGKIQDVNFWGIPSEHATALGRDRNAFDGNDFTNADLRDVAFNHIDLTAQQFPGPPDYALLDRVEERAAAALATIATWSDSELRENASFALRLRAENAARYNSGYALVSDHWFGHRLPPHVRSEAFRMLLAYNEDQQ